MAKYYVQSGTMRTIVQAESTRKAALWAVHHVMKQVLPIDDHDRERADASVTVMSGQVIISERGFDQADATNMKTMEVVSEWNQMVMTLDRLERMLYHAA